MKNLYRDFLIIILINSVFIVARAQNLSGKWKLIEAKQNGKAVDLGREIKTNLIFGDENRISGNGGCNRYSSTYKLESKNEIKFAPVISTRMACLENNLMSLEQTFFEVLGKTEKYQVKGKYLIFSDKAKKNVLRFVKVEK